MDRDPSASTAARAAAEAVLDAACGPGLYAVRLARMGWDVVGVDTGEPVLRHARVLAREAGVAAEFHRAMKALEIRYEQDAGAGVEREP